MKKAIDICLITWPNHERRLAYFRETVEALKANLTASRHELQWYCSAESERDPKYPWQGAELSEICDREGIVLSWRAAPATPGGNMNAALRLGTSPLVLLQQDDFLLTAALDLSPGADLLTRDRNVDLVRYNYPDNDAQRPTFSDYAPGWRQIALDGLWPYGDGPYLRRRDFPDKWGWYTEDRHHSQEGIMLHRLVAGKAVIVAPEKNYFRHFGRVTALTDDKRYATQKR